MAVYCDRYEVCKTHILGNESRARAAGWHIWEGKTHSGSNRKVVLCPRCVGRHRRPEPSRDEPEGEQLTMFYEVAGEVKIGILQRMFAGRPRRWRKAD